MSANGDEGPYRGLMPYREVDAAFFFGRTRETRIISSNLLASRLTLLYGASGVGKTSVLRAGVVKRLERLARVNEEQRGEPELAAAVISSWTDPLAALRERIASAGVDQESSRLEDLLAAWSQRAGGPLLLILDQFEEYFLYNPTDDSGSFAAELARVVSHPHLRVNVLISIREDALAQLDHFKGRVDGLFDNYLRIGHLDRGPAREAIEKPIARYNEQLAAGEQPIAIEPALVEEVLAQLTAGRVVIGGPARGVGAARAPVEDGRVETPYLQLVMTRLWAEEAASASRLLRRETLERLGGADVIVRTHVDNAMAALDDREQHISARLFHHLVTPSGTKIAHSVGDLAALVGESETTLVPILDKLAGRSVRILRPVAPRPDGAPGYEIFHDVLANAVLDWRSRHVRAAAERRLQLEHRRAEEERRKAFRNKAIRLFAVLLLLAVIGTSILTAVAIRQRELAQQERRIARSAELAAAALNRLPVDPMESVRLAQRALAVEPTEQAEDALRQSLPEMAVRRLMRGHLGAVSLAIDGSAFSPDGRRVVTAGDDGKAVIWDLERGEVVHHLRGHRDRVRSARFSPDGRFVVTASSDTTARIWRASSGRLLHVLRGHEAAVVGASFSRDGAMVVTVGGRDGTARIWWVAGGRSLGVLRGHRDPVVSAGFSPSGDAVITASLDGTARLWGRTGRLLRVLRGHRAGVTTASFSPEVQRAVTTSFDGTARIWDVKTGATVAVIHGDPNGIEMGAFSTDGRFLVTVGGKTAEIWDARTGEPVSALVGHSMLVGSGAFSPESSRVVTASEDNTARVWDVAGAGLLRELRGHSDALTSAMFTRDGKHVVTASLDGTVRVWAVGGETVLRGHEDAVLGVAFAPDGRRVATASVDATLRVWSVGTGRTVATLEHPASISGVSFSADGRRIVTAADDGRARIWSVATGKRVRSFRDPSSEFLFSAVLTRDGRFLVTAGNGGARLWDAKTGNVSRVLRRREWVDDAAFTADGASVVTASFDGVVRVWRRATGEIVALFRHPGEVVSATFSPDGARLVTGAERTVRIWDVRRRRLVHALQGFVGPVTDVTFTPDGRRVVAVGETTTRIWSAESGRLLAVVRMHGDVVNGVAVSRNGLIASASDDRTARLYACRTCGSLRDLVALAKQRLTDVQ